MELLPGILGPSMLTERKHVDHGIAGDEGVSPLRGRRKKGDAEKVFAQYPGLKFLLEQIVDTRRMRKHEVDEQHCGSGLCRGECGEFG
eukprot:5560401-Amphidinium_carterae.4